MLKHILGSMYMPIYMEADTPKIEEEEAVDPWGVCGEQPSLPPRNMQGVLPDGSCPS